MSGRLPKQKGFVVRPGIRRTKADTRTHYKPNLIEVRGRAIPDKIANRGQILK